MASTARPPSSVSERRDPAEGGGRPFGSALLSGHPVDAARALVGALLVRDDAAGIRIGRIVEVEAYDGEADRASHARFGPTARNRVMYGPAGIAYVYLVYGMYDCLNVVAGPLGSPSAVLIRAVQPLEGVGLMRAARLGHARRVHRSWSDARIAAERTRLDRVPDDRLASGPGAVTGAFSIGRDVTGLDLCAASSDVRLEHSAESPREAVIATPRIGVAYAGEPWLSVPWRLVVAGNPAVSGPRPSA